MIQFMTSKKAIYLITFLALGALFWMVKTHYINVGIEQCQAKIIAAENEQKERLTKAHIEALKDAALATVKLQTENNKLNNELTNVKKSNDDEADSACYSVNRLRGINTIRAQ